MVKKAKPASYDDGPACNAWTPALAKTPAYMAPTSHLLIMTALVIAQGILHWPEHVAQVLQKLYLGVPANGVIGQFNLEWVHFTYNVGLLAMLVPVMIGCGFFARNNAWKRANYGAWWLVMFSFYVQLWHVPEHYTKLAQYVISGNQATPGFLGYWLVQNVHALGVLWLHFVVNVIILVPMVYAFFVYDVPGALYQRFFGKPTSMNTGANS